MNKNDLMRKVLRIVLLWVLSLLVAFPVVYMLSSSLFLQKDFNRLALFPSSPAFSNYAKALGQRYFSYYLTNSIATSMLSALLRTVIVILASFALTHLEFRGRRLMTILLTLTLFVPQESILYQNYRTVAGIGLLDSWWGIIAPTLFSASQMLLLSGALRAMGRETYDAARIDGASDLRYITSVMTPLTAPVVMTILIQTLISTFNSYLWPLLVTNRPKTRTIQIGLTMLGFAEKGETGAQMATLALCTIPFLLVLALTKNNIEKALLKK